MKKLFFVPIVLLLLIESCKKSDTSSNTNTGGNGTQITRVQEGTDPTTDTVFKVVYSGNNIVKIIDSLNYGFPADDTLYATYDGSGKLISATDNMVGEASYTYNGDGTLAMIDENQNGEHEQYKYSYANGVVSQKAWYSDNGQGGTPTLSATSKFTVVNGNITEIKVYDKNNSPLADVTLTYGSQPNPFKQWGLLNIGNILGTDNFAGFDTYAVDSYFNTNIITGFSEVGGVGTATFTNTFNAQQLPTKVISYVPDTYYNVSFGTFTWQFSY